MKHRDIKRLSFEDAMQAAQIYRLHDDEDTLMVLEDFDGLPFSGKPLQTGFVAICLCKKGSAEFSMNHRRHQLKAGELLVLFGDAIIEDILISEDFRATAIVQSHDFMQETLMAMLHLWPYLFYLMEHPVLHLSETDRERVHMNYTLLVQRMKAKEHSFRREASIANLQAAYLDICDVLKRFSVRKEDVPVRSYALFEHFMRLMSKEYVTHRDVKWYAEQMNISPKYLSEAVKSASGKAVSQWIMMFVIMEIKYMLRNTELSIKEITKELNFPNQSFLGKYFKNVTGVSPLEYRNS